jgi:hypothetical protein
VEEAGRQTALLSREIVVPGTYSPQAAKDKLLFPIDVYSQAFRDVAASQAVFGIVCAIDRNGERAISGEQPDGEHNLLLLTASPRIV